VSFPSGLWVASDLVEFTSKWLTLVRYQLSGISIFLFFDKTAINYMLVVFYRKYMITLGALEKQQSLSGKLRLALSELPYDFEGSA
jgi:hypothetical protein